MTKFVILGSCRFEPYEILAVPEKLTDTLHTTEEGYELATKKFYPAIEESDIVIVYAPDGIGKHTQRDIDYAREKEKQVFKLVPLEQTKQKEMVFVTDGTEFSNTLIHKLQRHVKLIIREGAEEGSPVLMSDKGRFEGSGILFYLRLFCEEEKQ